MQTLKEIISKSREINIADLDAQIKNLRLRLRDEKDQGTSLVICITLNCLDNLKDSLESLARLHGHDNTEAVVVDDPEMDNVIMFPSQRVKK